MTAPTLSTHLNLFVATTDPRRYLPRAATEAALLWLERRIVGERAPATLMTGAPGMGKSLLLRVFAQRVRDRFRVVGMPGLDGDAATLCTMVLDRLKVDAGTDSERALLFHAARLESRGSALLLLIDEAQRLSIETAGRLGALAETSGGLRIVAATTEASVAFARALGAGATLTLRTPMDLAETEALIGAALASGWATPEVRDLFDRTTVARIHHEAKGVPGEVIRLAAEIADGAVREGFVAEPGRAVWRSAPAPRQRIVPL
jgi:replication-associated recombination protein RarA